LETTFLKPLIVNCIAFSQIILPSNASPNYVSTEAQYNLVYMALTYDECYYSRYCDRNQ